MKKLFGVGKGCEVLVAQCTNAQMRKTCAASPKVLWILKPKKKKFLVFGYLVAMWTKPGLGHSQRKWGFGSERFCRHLFVSP